MVPLDSPSTHRKQHIMAVNKNPNVTPVVIPVSNINQYIRVPGHPPTVLGKALQEWDGIWLEVRQKADKETPNEYRTIREIFFPGAEGTTKLAITEKIYEVALYTLATRRLADWMRDHKDQVNA